MRSYIAELHRQGENNGHFLARLHLEAENRGQAVHKAQLWYWDTHHGSLGPAHKVLVVNDPHEEVHYGPNFNCGVKANRLLSEEVIVRVLAEANGELVRDDRPWNKHHPPGSVRRVKRRRDFGRFILPNIRQMANGRLYYRVTLVSQRTKNGRRYRKRKYRDIPLCASVLFEAVDEIHDRALPAMHRSMVRRTFQSRSLAVLRREIRLLAEKSGVTAL